MKKTIVISGVLSMISIVMIAIALTLQVDSYQRQEKTAVVTLDKVDVKNMATANKIIETKQEPKEEEKIEEVKMEVAAQSIEPPPPPPPRVEVYEGMTLEELAEKINRNLNSTISNQGYLIASYSLELGVDPYIATAIMLHETGCTWKCSNLVNSCNNVGGQKGSPSCGGGSYKSFPTLEDGIRGFIENLQKNYYAYGLNTVEAMGPRYAESTNWIPKINSYVAKIRES